ncbi:MAG: hypothetical protein FWE22_01910 [Firmicutes bacterium]|nr:hypothetical protein [Bacillota bacterium]
MKLDYKQLAETIYTRKSTRSYSDAVVDILENGGDLVEAFGLQALLSDIKVSVRVLENHEVKNKKAKYCIGFYSEDKLLALENVGFIGQLLDLHLQAQGIATCWWGMKKPKKEFKSVDGLDCFITMMAGMPKVDEKREYPADFKRKAVEDIIEGGAEADNLIEAVRVAPSAVNRQPWLIEKVEDKYNFYLKNSKNPLDMIIGDMRNIDLGIAIAHLFVAATSEGMNVEFDFVGEDNGKHKFVAGVRVWS